MLINRCEHHKIDSYSRKSSYTTLWSNGAVIFFPRYYKFFGKSFKYLKCGAFVRRNQMS